MEEDGLECLPLCLCRDIDSSKLSRMDLVALSHLHMRATAASLMFGPRFLIPCFTKLLLCSVASSSGML
jgi:hypothetical protein